MHEPATDPNDLEKLFVDRVNEGDLEGLVALYEPDAILADGSVVAVGRDRIREFLARFLASRPGLAPGKQSPALLHGDLALTSSRLNNGDITAEIARRQPDGTWLWVVDQFTLGKAE